MTGTHHPNRPFAAAVAVVVAVIVTLAAVAVSNLADEHWLTGTVAILVAAGFTAALVVIRALMRLNGALIHQNARLLYIAAHPEAEVPSDRTA